MNGLARVSGSDGEVSQHRVVAELFFQRAAARGIGAESSSVVLVHSAFWHRLSAESSEQARAKQYGRITNATASAAPAPSCGAPFAEANVAESISPPKTAPMIVSIQHNKIMSVLLQRDQCDAARQFMRSLCISGLRPPAGTR